MPRPIWKDVYYVQIYELAKSGLSDRQIAKALGVDGRTYRGWVKRRGALRKTLELARGGNNRSTDITFKDYVFERLPARLQTLWIEIDECEELGNGIERIEALLAQEGKLARQHLFLYALTARNFNASQACKAVNITRTLFESWKLTDPDFAALVDEIHWHKQNFFEEALVKRVNAGDTKAILFANESFNKDRGYSKKQEVVVSGSINHAHAVVHVDDLGLDFETRKQILEKIREKSANLTVDEVKA